jgi:selenocysteine lyase/cysteine desulfurase
MPVVLLLNGPESWDRVNTPDVVGAIVLVAIDALECIGMATIAAHAAVLTAHALHRFVTVPGLCVFGGCEPVSLAGCPPPIPPSHRAAPASTLPSGSC